MSAKPTVSAAANPKRTRAERGLSYLRIRNWEKFQHYRDRRPIWIKLYVKLLQDADFLALSLVARSVYIHLLLLAPEYANAIPNDPELIAKLLRAPQRAIREALSELIQTRWLSQTATKRRASKPASKAASAERELEETSPLTPRERGTSPRHKGTAPRQRRNGIKHACGVGGCTQQRDSHDAIVEHRANVHGYLGHELHDCDVITEHGACTRVFATAQELAEHQAKDHVVRSRHS